MTQYQGHKNWNHWNVSLWINNDEGLYRIARELVTEFKGYRGVSLVGRGAAAQRMLELLHEMGQEKTPDGAPYSVSSIRAAMRDM
jgi:hypothetical protein